MKVMPGSLGREVGVANLEKGVSYYGQRTQARNLGHEGASRALPMPGTIGVSLGNATQANLAQENEMHVANSKL